MLVVEWPHQRMSCPSLTGIFLCAAQSFQGWRSMSYVSCKSICFVFYYRQGWLLWVGFRRSLTILKIFGCSLNLRGLSPSESWRGGSCCQESCQMRALSPFLTSQKSCLWMRGRFCEAVFHILDPWIWSLNLINWSGCVDGAYFCFQICA